MARLAQRGSSRGRSRILTGNPWTGAETSPKGTTSTSDVVQCRNTSSVEWRALLSRGESLEFRSRRPGKPLHPAELRNRKDSSRAVRGSVYDLSRFGGNGLVGELRVALYRCVTDADPARWLDPAPQPRITAQSEGVPGVGRDCPQTDVVGIVREHFHASFGERLEDRRLPRPLGMLAQDCLQILEIVALPADGHGHHARIPDGDHDLESLTIDVDGTTVPAPARGPW